MDARENSSWHPSGGAIAPMANGAGGISRGVRKIFPQSISRIQLLKNNDHFLHLFIIIQDFSKKIIPPNMLLTICHHRG
jgi:hypothetical protein